MFSILAIAALSCVDVTPPDSPQYTCAQQKSWGKCGETWMVGYCCNTCHQCKGTGCGSGPPSPPSPPSPSPPMPGTRVHITTCHNDNECGSVDHCSTGSDTISPTEGLFGTSCTCQDPSKGLQYVCTKSGKQISKCADGRAPNCKIACGQPVCVSMDGRQTTGKIRSACPLHHHQNVDDCCSKGGQWCTCVLEQNLDLNWKPYKDLGNRNGYGTASWGACGSSLHALNISIYSERANTLVQPFLNEPAEVCKGADFDATRAGIAYGEPKCHEVHESDTCDHMSGCVWCKASEAAAPVRSGCFGYNEASVLTHIMTTEREANAFSCVRE